MSGGGLNEAIRQAGMTHAEYETAMELTKEAREKYLATLEPEQRRTWLTEICIRGSLRALLGKWTKDGLFR